MTEQQIQLFDAPAEMKLTDRQQQLVDAIATAGYEGLDSAELGAIDHERLGKHSAGDRCQWCGQHGRQLGQELRSKGVVKQSRRKRPGGDRYSVWVSVDAPRAADQPVGRDPYPAFNGPIPF